MSKPYKYENAFCFDTRCCLALRVSPYHDTSCLSCLQPVFPSVTLQAGIGPRTRVATASALRLARFPLVSLPALQVSSSRRLGYERPERTCGKATPTRSRPRWHSFCIARALLQYTGLFKLVSDWSVALFYLIFLVCFTSQLCNRRRFDDS